MGISSDLPRTVGGEIHLAIGGGNAQEEYFLTPQVPSPEEMTESSYRDAH